MRTYLITVIICVGYLAVLGQDSVDSSAKKQVQQLYYQGMNQKAQGNTDLAKQLFLQVLEADHRNDAAAFELGRLYLEQGALDSALINAKIATESKADKDWYWMLLADVYKQKEDYPPLPGIFERLIRLKPENKAFYYDRAYSLYLNKKYDEALAVYDSIEQKFGPEDNLLLARQDIWINTKQYDKAIASVRPYIEQHPDQSKGYIMMANVYLQSKEPKKALKILDEGHEKIPGDPYISLSKADVYRSRKQDKAASVEIKNAFASEQMDIDSKLRLLASMMSSPEETKMSSVTEELAEMLTGLYPQDVRTFALYGDILAHHKKLSEARSQYLNAIEVNPSVNTVWEQLLQIELSIGLLSDALDHAKQANRLFPDQPVTQFFAGHAFFLNKDYESARTALEQALNTADEKNTPLMLQLYSSLGDAYNSLGMFRESDQAYEEALSIDSNNAMTLNNYSYYLSVRKERLDDAAEMSRRSNSIDPDNGTFQDTYAWVLYQQGKYTEAKDWIEKAIANSPDVSSTLLEHYGDILYKLGDEASAVTKWKAAKSTALTTGENIEFLTKKIDGHHKP